MTNEQIEKRVQELAESQAKSEVERRRMSDDIREIREELKANNKLIEEVHIMAKSIESMQKTLEVTTARVEAVEKKDYNNYLEGKKIVRNNIISGITGAILTGIIGIVIFIFNLYGKGGV